MNDAIDWMCRAICCTALATLPATAASIDIGPTNAWNVLASQLNANAGLQAQVIRTQYVLPADDAATTKACTTRLTDHGDQRQREPVGGEDAARADCKFGVLGLGLEQRIADRPDVLFERPADIAVSQERRDGESFVVMRFRSRFVGGKRDVDAKAWLLRESGQLVRVEGEIAGVGLPGVSTARFEVQYDRASGRVLPTHIRLWYDIALLFHHGSVKFTHDLLDWR